MPEVVLAGSEVVRGLVQNGYADLLGQVSLVSRLAFEIALKEVDQASSGAWSQDRLVGHGNAVEQPQRARVEALQYERFGGSVLHEDGDVPEVGEDFIGQLVQGVRSDLLEPRSRQDWLRA